MAKKIFVFGLIFIMNLNAFAHKDLPAMPSFELYPAGKINQCPVYQLTLNGLSDAPYQILIKDEYGDVLYEEYISGKEIVRNYMFDGYDLGNIRVSIEVINTSGSIVKKFSTIPDKVTKTL
jgi:hypothetical protein